MEQASSGRASRMNASESPLVPTGGNRCKLMSQINFEGARFEQHVLCGK